MSAASEVAVGATGGSGPGYVQVGRTFLHPLLDYLLIGGVLSLVVGLGLSGSGSLYPEAALATALPFFILAFNSAHFAASTVRLYTRPGAFQEWPRLTLVFPLIAVAVMTLAIVYGESIGRQLFALYLTWSPYHYAAQAFGLSAMYCYRSGCQLDGVDRRLLWWSCMLPFVYAFLNAGSSGLGWILPPEFWALRPGAQLLRDGLATALAVATFAAPLVLVLRIGRRGKAFPLIGLFIMLSNGIWWIAFTYLEAFLWATVFHGVQYLAIVTIFHVRDQRERPGATRGPVYHALWFYGVCLLLGYALFNVVPWAYVLVGFPLSESILLVAAVINIHHFVVDRFIWRLRKDPNYRIVVGSSASR